tara:strand:- start:137 stop:568 length:432 start_codon:yes stop_codon:yes gene_type:complete
MALFDTMNAAEPYLYFRGAADGDLIVQARKLTSIAATSGTSMRLTFTGNDYAHAERTQLKDANASESGSWQQQRHVYVNLTHAATDANFQKTFMKSLVAAINSPITVGDPNAKYDRGFIVIYDSEDTGSNFAGITGATVTTSG